MRNARRLIEAFIIGLVMLSQNACTPDQVYGVLSAPTTTILTDGTSYWAVFQMGGAWYEGAFSNGNIHYVSRTSAELVDEAITSLVNGGYWYSPVSQLPPAAVAEVLRRFSATMPVTLNAPLFVLPVLPGMLNPIEIISPEVEG